MSITLTTLILTTPSATANVVEDLALKNSLPPSITTNTLEVELLPNNYSQEIQYVGTSVCIFESGKSGCSWGYDLGKYPGLVNGIIYSDNDKKFSVLTVTENKFIFNFTSTGKFQIILTKRYTKDRVNEYDRLRSTIQIPLEIADVSKGGIDIRDLAEAGIKINPHPILKCPQGIKNFNGFITCDVTYVYDQQRFTFIVEPFEVFKICAYKAFNENSDCRMKNSYFAKDLKITFNTIEKIKIPIFKDYVSSIYLQSTVNGEAVVVYQNNLPPSKPTSTKGKSASGKWEKKCKNVVSKTNSQMEIIDGRIQGGPVTTITKVCEDVWVP